MFRLNCMVIVLTVALGVHEHVNFAAGSTTTCTTVGKASMSQGFITAALSALSPLGVGTCVEDKCNLPLAPCPKSSCCLSNATGTSSCGCVYKNSLGNLTCTDPKLLNIAFIACDEQSGQRHNITVQLYSVNKEACNNTSSAELIVSEEGRLLLQIQASICLANVLPRIDFDLEFDAGRTSIDITVTTDPTGDTALSDPNVNYDVSRLYHLLGVQHVEDLMRYHKSLIL